MIGCCRVRIVTLITPFLQVVPLLVVGGRVGSGFFLPVGVGYSCRRSGLPKMGLLADLISHTHILTYSHTIIYLLKIYLYLLIIYFYILIIYIFYLLIAYFCPFNDIFLPINNIYFFNPNITSICIYAECKGINKNIK